MKNRTKIYVLLKRSGCSNTFIYAIVCPFQQAARNICVGKCRVDFVAYLVFSIDFITADIQSDYGQVVLEQFC
jgi:hypothetical protein